MASGARRAIFLFYWHSSSARSSFSSPASAAGCKVRFPARVRDRAPDTFRTVKEETTKHAGLLEEPSRPFIQPDGGDALDLPRLGSAVVAGHRNAYHRRAYAALPHHLPPGQEHAQDAGFETGYGQDPGRVQRRRPETKGGDGEALPGAAGQPARGMPARPYTAPHLPRPVLHDPALRHARELQDRRPTVVPEPDPTRPPLHPPHPLHPHDDGLPGADHKEHGLAAETADALSAHCLRHLPCQVSLGALRLLDHFQLHHLRPELRDLLRPPAQACGARRGESSHGNGSRPRRKTRAGKTSDPAGPEEERPRQEQEEKEGREEEMM